MAENEHILHEHFMRRCIELAKIAASRGDSPVGSIIVKNSEIIAEGIEANRTKKDITCHAEIEAVRNAIKLTGNQDLSGCILYTTHEPCIMCSFVIRSSKISKVVAGLTTGEIGGFSSRYPILADRSVEKWGTPPVFVHGILEEECRNLHQ